MSEEIVVVGREASLLFIPTAAILFYSFGPPNARHALGSFLSLCKFVTYPGKTTISHLKQGTDVEVESPWSVTIATAKKTPLETTVLALNISLCSLLFFYCHLLTGPCAANGKKGVEFKEKRAMNGLKEIVFWSLGPVSRNTKHRLLIYYCHLCCIKSSIQDVKRMYQNKYGCVYFFIFFCLLYCRAVVQVVVKYQEQEMTRKFMLHRRCGRWSWP